MSPRPLSAVAALLLTLLLPGRAPAGTPPTAAATVLPGPDAAAPAAPPRPALAAPAGRPTDGPPLTDGPPPRPGRLFQSQTDGAYLLDVTTGGELTPEQISIEPAGQALRVSIGQRQEQWREQHGEVAGGWQRTYRWSSATRQVRLPVPADGDLSAMTRTDGPHGVRVVIPRRPPAAPAAAGPSAPENRP